MNFKLSLAKNHADVKTDCMVLGCFSDQQRWPGKLPATCRKRLQQMQKSGDLTGKSGAAVWLSSPACYALRWRVRREPRMP